MIKLGGCDISNISVNITPEETVFEVEIKISCLGAATTLEVM